MTEESKTEEERKEYEELVNQEPPREVVTPGTPAEGEKGKAPTISEAMEMSTDLTDLQFAMSVLFPQKIEANSVMVV